MADKEGNKTGGRGKGTTNKVTKETREAFKEFVENNHEHFQGWIERVAENNPAKAIELVSNLAEYVLPKLSRAEVVAEIETKEKIDLSNYKIEDLKKSIESNKD